MFNEHIFHSQIPKAQKDSQVISFFVLLGSLSAKAARKTLVKSTPGVNFINVLRFRTFAKAKM